MAKSKQNRAEPVPVGERVVDPDLFRPLQLPRASDLVVNALIDGIREGSVLPGSRLPRDHDLASQFGVSRPVVREALDQLRRGGLLEVRRGNKGGAFVKSVAIPGALLADQEGHAHADVRELLLARRAIEEATAALAAEVATKKDLDELEGLVDLLALDQAPADFVEFDVRFHLRLASAARNAPLHDFLRSVLRDLSVPRLEYWERGGDPSSAANDHRKVVTAVRTGSPTRAARAMRKHLVRLEQRFNVE